MGEFINRLREQLTQFYNGLDRTRKIGLALGSLFVVIVTVVLFIFFTRTSYVTIVSGVTFEEAKNITDTLTEVGIDWRVLNETTIQVDEDSKNAANMELATAGLLSANRLSFDDVMSQLGMMTTAEDREQMYLRLQIADLERSMMYLDVVEDARVILHVPNNTEFLISEESDAGVSVILKLKNNQTLSQQQVEGIYSILMQPIPGLVSENISVTDTTGRRYTLNDTGDFASFNDQYEMELQLEKSLNKNLKDYLETLFGFGNVVISSDFLVNYDAVTQTKVEFEPPIPGETTGMLRSVQETTKSSGTSGAEGVPGTDSNTDPTTYVEESAIDTSYQEAQRILNYELNQINTVIEQSPGTVERISVAITVNSQALADNLMTEEQQTMIHDLVAAAAGNEAMNIQVSAYQFADNYTDFTAEQPSGIPIWVFIIIIAVAGGLVVLGFMFYRNSKIRERREAEENLLREKDEEIESIIHDYEDKNSPKYQIEQFIEAKPEIVALLLRNWINEE